MGYLGMLKESWAVTWRHKKLWILGLLGGTTAGLGSCSSGGGGSNSGTGVQYEVGSEAEFQQALDWMHQYGLLPQSVDTIREIVILGLIILAALVVVGIIFWLIGIAARGGLVHLSREALEGREVQLNDGWRVGFRYWGRVFAIRFLLALPIALAVGIALALSAVALAPIIATGGDPAAIPMLGLLVLVPVFFIFAAIAGVVVHMLSEVAVRHAVLTDASITESISLAWNRLWAKRGMFTTWLMTLVVSWGIGIVSVVALVPFGLLLVGGIIAESVLLGVLAVLLMVIVLFVVAAISGTLLSTVWTTLYLRQLAEEPNA